MKLHTTLHTLLTAFLLVAFGSLQVQAATVTGRSAKSSLAGTEKIPIDDAGTDKYTTVADLLLTAQGAMTATTFNGLTIDTTTGTLDITNGKTLAATGSLTFAGTDGTTFTFPSGSGTVVTLDAVQTLSSKTLTSPTLTTPTLGVASATSINKVAITAPAASATLTIADGKTLTASNTLTLAGTDGTTMTFPSGSGEVVTADSTVTLTNKTLTSPVLTTPTLGVASATSVNGLVIDTTTGTFDLTNAKTFAVTHSLTLAGTDGTTMTFPSSNQTLVGLTASQTLTNKTLTSPVLTTPTLGVASATSVNKVAITAPATSATLTIADGKELTVSNSLTLAGTDSTTMTFPATSATVVTSSLSSNNIGAANAVWGASNSWVFEGASADTYELSLAPTDPTADNTVTFADASGTAVLSTLATNSITAANSVYGASNAWVFEGSTADGNESSIVATDPSADRTLTIADASGTIVISSLATNAPDAANSVTGASNAWVFEGATADAHELSLAPADATADRTVTFADASGTVMLSALSTNAPDAANSVTGASNALVLEGATADAHETSISPTDPTADRTITVPNASGTVHLAQTSTTTALTADDQAVTPGSNTVLQLTSDNATDTNRTFTLSATGAITGQIYVIIGPASNACEIADTGIQKLSATWSPGANDTLTLIFDGTNFNEIARSNN